MLVVRRVTVGPIAENTYLAGCDRTGEAVLVDPGGEPSRVLALREPGPAHLEQGAGAPAAFGVARIFLTHGHADHVAEVAAAKAATGARVTLHRGDAPWIDRFAQTAGWLGLEGASGPTVDGYHEDGETFLVGEQVARVIHTPGHSAGGCCLFFPDAKVLLTGDTLFAGSVGRTDLPGGDLSALLASIRDRIFALGDDVRFYPGHGPAGLVGDERRTNPFAGEASRRGRYV